MSGFVFEALWPVTDDQVLFAELRRTALPEFHAMAAREGVLVVPPIDWSTRDTDGGGIVLVASAAALQVGRHRDHLAAANAAAAERRGLVDAPECTVDGCWHVCGPSGVCASDDAAHHAARKRGAA